MAKLFFKFGAMGSYKTANALMTRFNYVQKGANVLLLKPKIDTRHEEEKLVSKIGLSAPCHAFSDKENLLAYFEKENEKKKIDVVILDEAQFCTKKQVEQLRTVSDYVPVFCYGLKTNFKGELFEGSKRLFEIADRIQELDSICDCGKKAIMNARFHGTFMDIEGEEVLFGDENYRGLCWNCYKKEQNRSKVHSKISKYIKIFSNKQSAGKWSTDTISDNVVLQSPYVIYDKDVQDFISDFKDFRINDPQSMLIFDGKVDTLRKISMRNKSFDYCMTLVSYVLQMEKSHPGMLKALIEDGTLCKWLKQIEKMLSTQENQFQNSQ